MSSFFYNLALFILGLAAAPKLLWNLVKKGKYRSSLRARFGFNLPKIPSEKKGPVIWLHAISVGESKAIAPLFQAIAKKIPHATIFISSITETGHEEAKRCLKGADGYFFLPLDFSWVIKKTMKQLRPDFLILAEGDFWYELLKQTKKRGGKCLLVNGKISERSSQRFIKASFFSKRLFSLLDALCVQSFRYAERFISLGIEKQKISITGNLKLDANPPLLTIEEKNRLRKELQIASEDRVIVIGSTHTGEEELLLKALKPLWQTIPQLKILIAPRHPERFSTIAEYLSALGYPVISYTKRAHQKDEKVMIIDTMGLLQSLYQLADVAIVAGSFVEGIGGHNIFEPIQFGIPTLFGEHMESQLDLVNLVRDCKAGIQVSHSNLLNTILELLQNPGKHAQLAAAAAQSAREARGATGRTLQILESYLVY
ncbi:MAG TPA: 3-deoxy-D-manno-octulosonic acid transferase [Rhabdochlamydiaceae bacterium]|nr:3-deoxy-D-manno-octulosonic acid transferase [Rhabdochlamydiaceae bacterium]